MKHSIIRILSLVLIICSSLFNRALCSAKEQTPDITVNSEACVVIEGSTGSIIFEKNKDKELIPASITKIMTLLLIFDNLESGKISLNDKVSVSEFAASMGGSQVYLEPGETQTVNDMIKCISIASANDAAVAMAEYIAGSEQSFVNMMNERAAGLGMTHTHFMNCNGLDDSIESGHYTSAYDVALMSRELIIKYPHISEYSTVWMDSITHINSKGVSSEFGLTNTNKLIRSYNGITGLKTGSTSKAKYCLSATANRQGMDIIAVVMAAPDHKTRFNEAASLLDYGFANCILYTDSTDNYDCNMIEVKGSLTHEISAIPEDNFNHVFTSNEETSLVTKSIKLEKSVNAPVKAGDIVGKSEYYYKDKKIGEINMIAQTDAPKATYIDYLGALYNNYISLRYSL